MRSYGLDEFVDELCEGMKPSAALRAYNSCKETYDWMRDELYLSGSEIAEISDTLSEHEDEVNALVEKATAERAAREAYDHPKLPKGFVTITQLQGDLDLGDLRDEVEDFDFDGDLTVAFSETADYKVDSNYHALLSWLPDHTEWLEQAEFDGLLEGCKEVFGILPGADDGGYSLSGEAKEAALSRFALPENRKAALDVIRKLNESRDSNENAL